MINNLIVGLIVVLFAGVTSVAIKNFSLFKKILWIIVPISIGLFNSFFAVYLAAIDSRLRYLKFNMDTGLVTYLSEEHSSIESLIRYFGCLKWTLISATIVVVYLVSLFLFSKYLEEERNERRN